MRIPMMTLAVVGLGLIISFGCQKDEEAAAEAAVEAAEEAAMEAAEEVAEEAAEEAAAEAAAIKPISQALDGQTFKIKMMKAGKFDSRNRLIFADGTFDAKKCRKYGFGEAAYKTQEKDGEIMFTATSTSEKHGENHWSGTVRGNRIVGALKWMPEGESVSYTFSGTLKE